LGNRVLDGRQGLPGALGGLALGTRLGQLVV